MKRTIIFVCVALLLAGLAGCTDNSKKTRIKPVSDNDVQESADVTNVVYTKYGIPLPIDLFKYLVRIFC